MNPIYTERLVIRNFVEEDAPALYDYLSRPDVLKYEPGEPETEERCRFLAKERSESDIFLAVCLRDTGKLIGHLFVLHIEPLEFETWEIGYIFNPTFGKHGYATESAWQLVDWLFREQNAHRVMALCNPENTDSWHLLERLGMRREGCFRKKAFFRRDPQGNPLWHDAYEYAVLEESWRNMYSGNSSPFA